MYKQAGAFGLLAEQSHPHNEGQHQDHDSHSHSHDTEEGSLIRLFLPPLISLVLLLTALVFDHWFEQAWFNGYLRLGWYLIAYLIVGYSVIKDKMLLLEYGKVKYFLNFF